MQTKIDLHVHSLCSADSIITPREIVFFAKKRGLTAVAVTDHNSVEGAKKIARETDFLIIPGTEVSSLHGHIIGLNVQEVIQTGLSADETVDKIHQQGGIAIGCHPFALFKGSVGKHLNEKFDAVETINSSSVPFKSASRKADLIATRLKLSKVAGTDAHVGQAIGCAYTLVDAEPTADTVIKSIVEGRCQPFGGAIPFSVRIRNQMRFLKKYL